MHATVVLSLTLSTVVALGVEASAPPEPAPVVTPETSSAAVRPEPGIATEAPAAPRKAGIAWFANWDTGLAEARRSGRPIMLQFMRPACRGVSGVF